MSTILVYDANLLFHFFQSGHRTSNGKSDFFSQMTSLVRYLLDSMVCLFLYVWFLMEMELPCDLEETVV